MNLATANSPVVCVLNQHVKTPDSLVADLPDRAICRSLPLPSGSSFEFWEGVNRFGYVSLAAGQVYWCALAQAAPIPSIWRCAADFIPKQPLIRAFWPAIQEPETKNPIKLTLQIGNPPWTSHQSRASRTAACFFSAMLPMQQHQTLGKERGQAVEDAAMLSQCLCVTRDLAQSFLQFDRQRRPRTTKIANMSWQLG